MQCEWGAAAAWANTGVGLESDGGGGDSNARLAIDCPTKFPGSWARSQFNNNDLKAASRVV